MSSNQVFRFIDLFSGVGGFHQAMKNFGGRCVLASDINAIANEVYENNYGIKPYADVRTIKNEDIPDHEVLCAGFPCQAFSKAGKQEGFLDKTRGTLFFEVARIIKAKKPKYVLLENVRNLASHDGGNTYETICGFLNEYGYRIPDQPLILSPHQFGVPQIRERVFIPALYDPKNREKPLKIRFKKLKTKDDNSIFSVIDENEQDASLKISQHIEDVLSAWDEFYQLLNKKTIGFPIWFDYFNNRPINKSFPEWKQDFIRKNKDLYFSNKTVIDSWKKKWNYLRDFTPTQRKFEWQCGSSIKSVWEGTIQIRPSGVRVKKPNAFPALVALVQTSIIGKFKRYISPREAASLQSFPKDFKLCSNKHNCYKQFGNSVNVTVLEKVFEKLIKIGGGF